MSDMKIKIQECVKKLLDRSKRENKKTAFIIGNTAKKTNPASYLIPYRDIPVMVTAGVIVYSEQDAKEIAAFVDGKVDYIVVDAEKKIADADSVSGNPGNIERAVRENVSHSRLWTFKGNDVSVDAADALLVNVFEKEITGIGGKEVAVIGCGNIGTKLALKLVERGAQVRITRRNTLLLNQIETVINSIKPEYTTSEVRICQTNEDACCGADVIIGVSQGIPVIAEEMIKNAARNVVLLDIGKGSFEYPALSYAVNHDLMVYRLDIAAAIAGVLIKLYMMDEIYQNGSGRKKFHDVFLVAGGVMGHYGDIVVDSVAQPQEVYGIADGAGDFIRPITVAMQHKLNHIKESIL